MDANKIIEQAREIIARGKESVSGDIYNDAGMGLLSEASEFLRKYVGENSPFVKNLSELKPYGNKGYILECVEPTLEAFIHLVEMGTLDSVSIERQAQIDVVSDILSQAQLLLKDTAVHPAAPAMIIGASLEEFLRNWVEEAGLSIGSNKPSIDTYAKELRKSDLITKQDIKDITSWAGNRNDAAHGEWDKVADKNKIDLMLQGVNLFMRKYGSE